jgi:hypothetical protein
MSQQRDRIRRFASQSTLQDRYVNHSASQAMSNRQPGSRHSEQLRLLNQNNNSFFAPRYEAVTEDDSGNLVPASQAHVKRHQISNAVKARKIAKQTPVEYSKLAADLKLSTKIIKSTTPRSLTRNEFGVTKLNHGGREQRCSSI